MFLSKVLQISVQISIEKGTDFIADIGVVRVDFIGGKLVKGNDLSIDESVILCRSSIFFVS